MTNFEKFYNTEYRSALLLATYYIGMREPAKDVISEAFLRIWLNWVKIEDKSEEKRRNYLLRVVRNLSFNHMRDSRRYTELDIGWMKTIEEEIDDYQFRAEVGLKKILDAMQLLPERQIIILIMTLRGMKMREIAKEMKIPYKSGRNSKSLAVKSIKAYLKRDIMDLKKSA